MSGSRRCALSVLAACAAVSLLSSASLAAASKVHLTLTSTEQLHAGEGSYEAWLYIGGIARSLGKFQMDNDNVRMRDLQGVLIPDNVLSTNLDVSQATELWITTEPDGDNDSTPAYKFLSGPITTLSAGVDSCVYNSAGVNGMGVSFTNAAGTFLLTTPTIAGHDTSGVWYMNKCTSGATSTLTLPTLPTGAYGWQYQGWIADVSQSDAIPFSTGEFHSTAGADGDAGGCMAGPLAPPAFPGSDFVMDNGLCTEGEPYLPILNNGNWSVVITVEPNPNTGPLPFAFKPLQVSNISPSAASCVSQNLQNFSGNLPRGTATLVVGSTPVRASSWGALKNLYR